MSTDRKKYSPEFKEALVRLVVENGRTQGSVADEYDVKKSTLGNWISKARHDGSLIDESQLEELERLRKEAAEKDRKIKTLRDERDVLKRSVVLWVQEAIR